MQPRARTGGDSPGALCSTGDFAFHVYRDGAIEVDLPQGVPTPRQPQALPEEMRSLSPEACHLLEVAAVFGRTFAVDDLAVVLGEAIGQVLGALRETLAADVLVSLREPVRTARRGSFRPSGRRRVRRPKKHGQRLGEQVLVAPVHPFERLADHGFDVLKSQGVSTHRACRYARWCPEPGLRIQGAATTRRWRSVRSAGSGGRVAGTWQGHP